MYNGGHTLRPYQLEGLNWLSFCWCAAAQFRRAILLRNSSRNSSRNSAQFSDGPSITAPGTSCLLIIANEDSCEGFGTVLIPTFFVFWGTWHISNFGSKWNDWSFKFNFELIFVRCESVS